MRFLNHQVAATALCVVLSIQTAYTSNLYAFHTDRGIQVIAQDPNSGNILHSSCNSSGTPVFPIEKPNVLPTFSKPRNGTALAAAGWWDGTKISASVFFQNEDGDITHGFYTCDMKNGRFNRTGGESTPSSEARVDPVHERTGLSVELLGQQDGYRIFYHNMDNQVMMMTWKPDTKVWTDAGAVSLDPRLGTALGSAYREDRDISVVIPRGSRNIEVARLTEEDDDLWQLESFPQPLNGKVTNETKPDQITFNESITPEFSLPFWDPNTQAIGHSVAKSLRELYYIGTDRTLYQARESDSGDGWILGPNASYSNWPRADDRSGGLAVVSPPQAGGEVWVYYWADGAIIEAHKSRSGIWDEATTLPANVTFADDSNEHEQPDDAERNDGPGSWSTAVKVGVGVSVSVAVIGVGALSWFLIRRHFAPGSDPKAQDTGMESGSHSDLPEVYIVQRATPIAAQSSAGMQPVELEQPVPVYELVGHSTQ